MKTKLRFLLLALSGLMAAASAEMVRVEGGTFVMTDCHNRKQRVTVSDFEIETTERGFLDNWWQAVAECNRLSRKEGYTPCYSINGITDEREWGDVPYREDIDVDVGDLEFWLNIKCDFNADGYRLPTSAEWEWAARGGKKSRGYRYSGSDKLDEVGWYDGNVTVDKRYYDIGGYFVPDTNGHRWQAPAQKKPNELGLYDMSGNLWEWCWNGIWENIPFCQMNPTGYTNIMNKELRGGSWRDPSGKCELTSCETAYASGERYSSFRLCRSLSKNYTDTIRLENNESNREFLKPVMLEVPCTDADSSLGIKTYEMAETELSRELYALVTGTELYLPEGNLPAEGLSWYEAVELCNRLSMIYGYTPCYTLKGKASPDEWGKNRTEWKDIKCDFNAEGYRLPTEAEWQYAAMSGYKKKTCLYTGRSNPDNPYTSCWYVENSKGRCHPGGTVYSTEIHTPLGLCNMCGNVQEWCWDSYGKNGSKRSLRGGSYRSSAEDCTIYSRDGAEPDAKGGPTGLRLCRSLGRKNKGIVGSIIDFILGLFS